MSDGFAEDRRTDSPQCAHAALRHKLIQAESGTRESKNIQGQRQPRAREGVGEGVAGAEARAGRIGVES